MIRPAGDLAERRTGELRIDLAGALHDHTQRIRWDRRRGRRGRPGHRPEAEKRQQARDAEWQPGHMRPESPRVRGPRGDGVGREPFPVHVDVEAHSDSFARDALVLPRLRERYRKMRLPCEYFDAD